MGAGRDCVGECCELIFTADRSGHESEVSGAGKGCVRAERGVVTRVRGGPEMIRAEGVRSRGVQTIVPNGLMGRRGEGVPVLQSEQVSLGWQLTDWSWWRGVPAGPHKRGRVWDKVW